MRKNVIFAFVFISVCLVLADSLNNPSSSFPNGAPTGMTGSPGNGSQNCSSCHGSSPVFVNGLITSNIPQSGYVPGQIYQFTAAVNTGDIRYGFSATVQDTSGVSHGILQAGSNSQLFSFNQSDDHITHQYPDSTGQWVFNWQAPQQDSLDISVYAAFVASDAGTNDTASGIKQFKVLLTSLALGKQGSITVNEETGTSLHLPLIYPQPATDKINISINRFETSGLLIEIYNAEGKKIKELYRGNIDPALKTFSFSNISGLANGMYFIKIEAGQKIFYEKWLKIDS